MSPEAQYVAVVALTVAGLVLTMGSAWCIWTVIVRASERARRRAAMLAQLEMWSPASLPQLDDDTELGV